MITGKALLMTAKKRLKLLVAIPLVVALCFFGAATVFTPTSYSATSKVVVSTSIAAANSLASSMVADCSTDEVKVSTGASTSGNAIRVTAKGANSTECIRLANVAALKAQALINESLPDSATQIVAADSAKDATPSAAKNALAVLVALFALEFAAIVVVCLKRKLIYSWRSLEYETGLPYLGSVSDDDAANAVLAASIALAGRAESAGASGVAGCAAGTATTGSDAAGDAGVGAVAAADGVGVATGADAGSTASVCLIPVGTSEQAALLAQNVQALGKEIEAPMTVAPSIKAGSQALYDAQESCAVVLCVASGASSYNDLDQIRRAFRCANIVPVGFVFDMA